MPYYDPMSWPVQYAKRRPIGQVRVCPLLSACRRRRMIETLILMPYPCTGVQSTPNHGIAIGARLPAARRRPAHHAHQSRRRTDAPGRWGPPVHRTTINHAARKRGCAAAQATARRPAAERRGRAGVDDTIVNRQKCLAFSPIFGRFEAHLRQLHYQSWRVFSRTLSTAVSIPDCSDTALSP